MVFARANTLSQKLVPKLTQSRFNSTLDSLKALVKSSRIKIGEWKSLKIPPNSGPKILSNNYVPFSKRFLFREIVSDPKLVHSSKKEAFENIALYLDEKASIEYSTLSEELSVLLKPLLDNGPSPVASEVLRPDAVPEGRDVEQISRKQRLDHEYWFIRKLAEVAPAGGFVEISREALQEACLPRISRGTHVKTYVDPSDYDVLRVWTRGLHPSRMYPIDRSLSQPSTTEPSRSLGVPSVQRWLSRLTSLITPKAIAPVPKEQLCYGHVLIVFRLKEDDRLCLRMLKHVPVSAKASGNLFAEGIVDLLPQHRFLSLSHLSQSLVLGSTAVGAVSLLLVTPIAFLVSSSPELVLAWSVSAASIAATTAACTWLRHWKLRADWSERLRVLTLACDFNSGSFALAHLLGLSQAELLKSSLLVYSLLLQATSDGAPLNRSQLEIRIESWVAQRLSPRTHQGLPATSSATASGLGLSRFAKNFTGGSGPLFDLTFDSQPALAFLRKLDLVRGSDERLEAVLPNVLTRSSGQTVARAWSFLSPQCDEDDLGFPRVAIKQ
ncbi:hypothetical protein AAHC03_020952 [Spirometra sp. Aus1]